MTRFATLLSLASVVKAYLVDRDIELSLGSQLSHGAAIYSPSSPQWANESSRWSTYSQPTFTYVVVPATEGDIVATIKYATSNNISFLAQGGGHGYSATLNVIQNAIMINMQNFDYAIADTPSSMRVGGGTHYGTLIPALYEAGRELPVGVSPCVGATGATIGGGLGRLSGKHGLMIDAVSSFRMILADGKVLNVSSTSHPDLFYGMKGAGQLFGVIIETIYNTYPAGNHGQFYNVDMTFSGAQLESTLSVINKIIPNQPAELALIILFAYASPSPIVKVNLVWAGPRSTGLQYSTKFNATGPQSFVESMLSFTDLPTKSVGGSFTLACAKGGKQNNYSANMKYFDLTTFRSVFNQFGSFLTAYPSANQSAWLIEVFGQQGERSFPDSSAAYPNRMYDNIRPIIGATYYDDAISGPVDQYLRTVRDEVAETSGYDELHIYQNYAHGDEPLEALYGYEPGQIEKLQCLKAKYDPLNFFRGYHGVPMPVKGLYEGSCAQ